MVSEIDWNQMFENFVQPNWGGISEGFEFQMDDDTEVYFSCSAKLNDELFVFGGNASGKKKQVYLISYSSVSPSL